jgi:hypothetical protein
VFPFCPFRGHLLVFHFENLGDGPETKKGQENPKKNQLKKTRENDVPFRNSFNSLMVGIRHRWNRKNWKRVKTKVEAYNRQQNKYGGKWRTRISTDVSKFIRRD